MCTEVQNNKKVSQVWTQRRCPHLKFLGEVDRARESPRQWAETSSLESNEACNMPVLEQVMNTNSISTPSLTTSPNPTLPPDDA